ncbi:MAG: barstar family protein [Acidaminococcaceae bacterium]|nr:barstar family protein [Acidaminococcaceae bacterium]
MMCNNSIQRQTISNEELYTMMCKETEKGRTVCHIRGRLCNTLDYFFREVSAALRFPYYFGWNWNAFDECMTDLEWMNVSSLLIVFDDYSLMTKNADFCGDNEIWLQRHIRYFVEYWINAGIDIQVILNR